MYIFDAYKYQYIMYIGLCDIYNYVSVKRNVCIVTYIGFHCSEGFIKYDVGLTCHKKLGYRQSKENRLKKSSFTNPE